MSKRSNPTQRCLLLLICCTASVAAGCEDPLTDPAVIIGPRIVGARVASAADRAVAEPGAGEAASIEWLVLSNEPGSFVARIAWCKASATVIGAPRCDGSTFAEQTANGGWGAPLAFDFSVPSELEPRGAWLAWIGICSAGEAAFDPAASTFACSDGPALSGFYRGFVPDAVPNRNPSLADDSVLLDGVAWPAPATMPDGSTSAVPGAACAGLGLPTLQSDQPASVGFELGGDDREPLDDEPGSYAAHPRESLVYTHLANLPGLDRAFSAIDYDAEQLGFQVDYEFSEEPPGPEGITLGFFLLARDERGGVDWLERRACLLPP
jgi:hypothetical protein